MKWVEICFDVYAMVDESCDLRVFWVFFHLQIIFNQEPGDSASVSQHRQSLAQHYKVGTHFLYSLFRTTLGKINKPCTWNLNFFIFCFVFRCCFVMEKKNGFFFFFSFASAAEFKVYLLCQQTGQQVLVLAALFSEVSPHLPLSV